MVKNKIKKAILINDTSYDLHHGCRQVIENIHKLLNVRNIKIIFSLDFRKNWQKEKEFYKQSKKADIIIINGEGFYSFRTRTCFKSRKNG